MGTDLILFLALLFVAAAIGGATAFVIFWPLASGTGLRRVRP